MAKQQDVILRAYDLGGEHEISLSDIRDSLQEIVTAANLDVSVYKSDAIGFPTIALSKINSNDYMTVHTYLHSENRTINCKC